MVKTIYINLRVFNLTIQRMVFFFSSASPNNLAHLLMRKRNNNEANDSHLEFLSRSLQHMNSFSQKNGKTSISPKFSHMTYSKCLLTLTGIVCTRTASRFKTIYRKIRAVHHLQIPRAHYCNLKRNRRPEFSCSLDCLIFKGSIF